MSGAWKLVGRIFWGLSCVHVQVVGCGAKETCRESEHIF